MDHSHESGAEAAHHPSYALYVKIWAILVLLTGVTVGAAYTNLHHLGSLVAILIATTKATLVLLYFMHLKYERRSFTWMFLATMATYVIFVILTFADYAFR